MKKLCLPLFLSCLSLTFLSALPKVAVLDIIAQKGIDASVIVPVTESIMEEVVGTRAYMVLDRAYVAQILKEQEFNLSAMVNDTQATQAGQFLGADYVVTGKVQLLGDSYFLVAKMIEVRTGVIVAQSSEQGAGKLTALLDMAHAVGRKIVSGSPISPLTPGLSPPVGSAPATGPKRIKAGFVTLLGMNDSDQTIILGIKRIQAKHKDWLDTVVVDRVTAESAPSALDRLADADSCDIIFMCNWGFQDQCREAAARHPHVKFQNMGGDLDTERFPNMGVYGVNDISHSYVEGLVAGALSSSAKIAYLSESAAQGSWVYQMANYFALGVKAANPKATVFVHFLPENHWDVRGTQTSAAKSLIAKGCDFFGGVDGDEVMETLNASAVSGKRVRMYQKDLSYKRKPNVIVSGPIRDFLYLYEKPLLALKEGAWKSEAFYPAQASKFGGGEIAFNPAFLEELRSKKIKTPDMGVLGLLDLINKREQQIDDGDFEPFTGPVKDQKGKIRLPEGIRAEWSFFENMDWFVDNVK